MSLAGCYIYPCSASVVDMHELLNSLAALLPALRADADAVLRAPQPAQWSLLYKTIILRHLVYNAAHYDRDTVERARTAWFRYISVMPLARITREAAVVEVDMKPRRAPTTSVADQILLQLLTTARRGMRR